MADATIASVIPFEQPRPGADTALTQRPKTPAERAKAYRARKRAKAGLPAVLPPRKNEPALAVEVVPVTPAARTDLNFNNIVMEVGAVTPAAPVTRPDHDNIMMSAIALRLSALALAAVGLSMNAVYARSLGSSDLSGWLFLALGVAADCAALALPTVAASTRGGTRAAAWLTWAAVFAFAILGSVGFASTSISDVTLARSSRVTPVTAAAQAALADAMRSRDAECRGGVGRFCRERQGVVEIRAHELDVAMAVVSDHADPQTAAVTLLVRWVTAGAVVPTANDVAMVRLLLLALLPQVGGIMMMVARRS